MKEKIVILEELPKNSKFEKILKLETICKKESIDYEINDIELNYNGEKIILKQFFVNKDNFFKIYGKEAIIMLVSVSNFRETINDRLSDISYEMKMNRLKFIYKIELKDLWKHNRYYKKRLEEMFEELTILKDKIEIKLNYFEKEFNEKEEGKEKEKNIGLEYLIYKLKEKNKYNFIMFKTKIYIKKLFLNEKEIKKIEEKFKFYE